MTYIIIFKHQFTYLGHMSNVKARVKFWMESENGLGLFGQGKYRLLKAIEETGSLSAAAESLNMSYRKAWGDLNKAEAGFGFKLIEKRRGGAKGGMTEVTEKGRELVAMFEEMTRELMAFVNDRLSEREL